MSGLVESDLSYDCAREDLPRELAERFVALACDEDTRGFIRTTLATPHGRLRSFAYAVLRSFLSDYDAYGLLHMYPMHLLSSAQMQALLGDKHAGGRLLDVGAGNGDITSKAISIFDRVMVTESSAVMRRRLRKRGFEVLDIDLAHEPLPLALQADAVLCLNVLDRCSHPRTLLRHLRTALAPNGRLVLSVPLPLRPHVQHGGYTGDPEETLPASVSTWEGGAASIWRELLTPLGFRVERLSRAPYLCRGDSGAQCYVLDSAIFVCSYVPVTGSGGEL
jgi:SAM-dependent methyltransferase